MDRLEVTPTQPSVPDLHLEQYALGELTGPRLDAVAQYARTPEGEERLAALAASDRDALRAHPPRVMAAAITTRAEQAASWRADRAHATGRALRLSVATALAALLIGVTLWLARSSPSPDSAGLPSGERATAAADFDRGGVAEVVRLKGLTPHLLIHRKAASGDAPAPLAEGATARAGDVLQVSYVAADALYGVVLSLDGRGAVTLHFPADAQASTALTAGGAIPLPHAYLLDDAPAFERFILITSPQPLDIPQLLQAADGLARDHDLARVSPLSIPSDAQQHSLLLLK
jgi:hypothetical protein